MILDDFEKMATDFNFKTQVQNFNAVLKSIHSPICIEVWGETGFMGISLCLTHDSELKELICPLNQNYLVSPRAFQNFLNGLPFVLQKKYDYEMKNPNGVDLTDLMWISEVYAREMEELTKLIKNECFLQKCNKMNILRKKG